MSEQVVVVGAAGFGRESLDVLDAMIASGARLEILGVVDDAPGSENLACLATRGVKYLGTLEQWLIDSNPTAKYVIGIGNPKIRIRLAKRLEEASLAPFTAVHPTVTWGANSEPAVGAVICAGAVISNNVRFGRYVHVNPNVTIGHDVTLSDFVSINPAATISGDVKIGKGTLIGAAATVLQGLSVGADSVVGASSLITKPVPHSVVVKGIPGTW